MFSKLCFHYYDCKNKLHFFEREFHCYCKPSCNQLCLKFYLLSLILEGNSRKTVHHYDKALSDVIIAIAQHTTCT